MKLAIGKICASGCQLIRDSLPRDNQNQTCPRVGNFQTRSENFVAAL